MTQHTRRKLLVTTAALGTTLFSGCIDQFSGGTNDEDEVPDADSQASQLGVEPVVETTQQHGADWRNTAWISGTTLIDSPNEVWKNSLETYNGIQSAGNAHDTTAYFFTDDQQIIGIDSETGTQTSSNVIGIRSSPTPITHNGRTLISGEINTSDFAGIVTMLSSSGTDRIWNAHTQTSPSSDLTTYLSHSYIGTETGTFHCFNNQIGESEWSVSISDNSRIIGSPPATRTHVYPTTPTTVTSLHRETGAEQWNAEINDELITNVSVYDSFVLTVTATTISAFDTENGEEHWTTARRSPDPNAFMTVSNDLVIMYRGGGNQTDITAYDVTTGDEQWTTQLPGVISAQPIVSNALAYIPQENGLVAWNTLGQVTEWEYSTPSQITHPPVVTTKTVILQTDSELIAIQ